MGKECFLGALSVPSFLPHVSSSPSQGSLHLSPSWTLLPYPSSPVLDGQLPSGYSFSPPGAARVVSAGLPCVPGSATLSCATSALPHSEPQFPHL